MQQERNYAVEDVRRRVIGRVKESRSVVDALAGRVGSAWADTRLSQQGREEEAARIVSMARAEVLEAFEDARYRVDAGLRDADEVLGRLRHVEPEVLSTRSSVLSPVLGVAFDRPEVLINAYRRRFSELPDRRLLEETAQVVIDGLGGSDGGQFAQQWRDLREELAASLPADELRAISAREALDELAAYLGSAERVANFGLNELDPEVVVPDTAGIAVQMDVAAVNKYETLYASDDEDEEGVA